MRLIDQFSVPRHRGTQPAATVELLQGDLSAIPAEHAVDALVVSAFPNSYTPNRGTLFEALLARGLDMQDVARHKQEDQRSRLGCWISQPLLPELAHAFNFTRIVCFEPSYPAFVVNSRFDAGSIADTVGFVFRCLNNFAIPEGVEGRNVRRFDLARIAMPLLAAGNQRVPVEAMLPRLLEAAVFWLEQGLPIDQLKIVTFSEAETVIATRIFSSVVSTRRAGGSSQAAPEAAPNADWRADLAGSIAGQVIAACRQHLQDDLLAVARPDERSAVAALFERLDATRTPSNQTPSSSRPPAGGGGRYDVFISYAHKQDQEVQAFVQELQRHRPLLRIFHDRAAIPAGGQWLKMISDAVHHAATFIAVLSPDYTASPVCWDEFQCAKLKEYNTRSSVIKTVRLYSERELPPIIGIYSYVDCAEGDLVKLRACAGTVLS
jgi:TIR domain-containing protein